LDRITHFVENISWEGRKPVPTNPNLSDGVGFWMDTLCKFSLINVLALIGMKLTGPTGVPVDDKQRKKKAIANMRHVYSKARAV
jgi:hypothetical protein